MERYLYSVKHQIAYDFYELKGLPTHGFYFIYRCLMGKCLGLLAILCSHSL